MKRGKDDDKIMGPMFPRLHVNDTEKGGPRAPPRNKMALYEQFTIPSQRYSSNAVPPKQNNNCGVDPSTSTSQGTCRERNTYLHLYRPPSGLVSEEIQVRNAEALSLDNQLVRLENKKKPVEEEDFMVPIFSLATTEFCSEHKSQNSMASEGILATTIDEETCQSNNGYSVLKQQIKNQDENTSRVSASSRNSLDISARGRDNTSLPKDASLLKEHHESHTLTNLKNSGACLLNDHGDSLPVGDVEINNEFVRIDDDQYLEKDSTDRGDDVSETCMVDCASEFDITPDDVVDIIGRKQFWKARGAIVNQQRVFAVQIFELHRLLKVQKLIAGSPNLLLEASVVFSSKSSVKGSSVDKYSSEFVEKPLRHKSTNKVEGTAENAGPKEPVPTPPSQNYPGQHTGYQSTLPNIDPKMNPWAYHQPSSHQWLVPVMSPSEGLVYKPFPAPGFMGPLCGGFGPVGLNPQYNLHSMGMPPPGIHFDGQGYFPPYGMPMTSSNVSGSTVIRPNPYNPTCQQGGATLNLGQDKVNGSHMARSPVPKEVELQGSTASSPSDRVLGIETVAISEGREKRVGVIRVVPHRSTRESAARIFQSIQQERRVSESS